ncbi:DUF523 domain-containing protein [Cognaticolwellia mytili]|uniref:DUF523 domain-containing protein n=1 Tax=Cognaticolwellia mytili TaxID=1888913 RepID=UPI000A178232|nr:DUF523 domain-containing protein [Cognaticolwellia mytili]
MEKILISSCFLGNKVRYDGKDNLLTENFIQRWQQEQRLVVICPELAGGLLTPRAPAEIKCHNDDGIQVVTNTGGDVTVAFQRGANEALRVCQLHGIRYALLKESSPSCGSSTIYDGSFKQSKIPGQGITTRLLTANGIKVYSEKTMAALCLELATIAST